MVLAGDIFPPKSKEEIQKSFLWLPINEFMKRRDEYKDHYKEELPDEFYPLIYHMHELLKKSKVPLHYMWGGTEFRTKIRGDNSRFLMRSKDDEKYVSVLMTPYRKRKALKKITFGNEFRFTNIQQFKLFLYSYDL